MIATATAITAALLGRLDAIDGLTASYGPPRFSVQAGMLFLIGETDAQARAEEGRQPSTRVRERGYRIEVYLPRAGSYYARQDDALRAICAALCTRPPGRVLDGLAYSISVGDVTLDDPALGSDLATLTVPLTVRYADALA